MLKLITGPANSGKSKNLVKYLLKERERNKKIMIFRPALNGAVKSYGVEIMERELCLPAIPIKEKMNCTCPVRKSQAEVIGIDDCHLFEGKAWFLETIKELLSDDPRNPKYLIIILAGLGSYEYKKHSLMRELRRISTLCINLAIT